MQSPANEIDNSLFEDGNKEQVRKTFCKSLMVKLNMFRNILEYIAA
jgi:hypothetical protein